MHARSTGHLRQGLPCVFENGSIYVIIRILTEKADNVE